MTGQMFRSNPRPIVHDHVAADAVDELSNISRPGMGLNGSYRLSGEATNIFPHLIGLTL